MITIQIDGADAIKRALAEVADKVERRYTLVALAAATAVVRDEAVAQAPVYHGEVGEGHPPPGTLKKAIKIAREKGAPRGFVGYYVYVKSGKGSKADAYYWKWVEFGHYTKGARAFKQRAGRNAGDARVTEQLSAKWIEPNAFMRRGFDIAHQAAIERFASKLREQLQPDGLR